MKRLAVALLLAIVGYGVLAVIGYGAISLLSSNTHDRSLEAAMTAAFVFGPVGAVAGGIAGAWVSRPRPLNDSTRGSTR